MKYKAVHIVFDDKFIDGAISLFESDDRINNTYIIIGEERVCKYIKNTNVQYVPQSHALEYINQFDIVVLHSLPTLPIEMIHLIDKRIKVIWYAWGYDIYENPYNLIPLRLFGPETRKATTYERFRRRIELSHYRKWFRIRRYIKSAISRIDYFSGVFPYEIDLIKRYNPEFKAFPLDFYYGSTSFFIPEKPSTFIKHKKHNIIIGNSADPAGNHLEVLKLLSSIEISKESKIIIPLSYGGSTRYVNKVESKANHIAPGQVESLKKYLPLNEYIELISNCRTAVFAHERQQASDNIFLQLLYGARVYLSETSAAYDYLKSIGLRVFSLQNELKLFNVELSDDEVYENRRILSERYSSSKLIQRIRAIDDILLNTGEF